MEGREQKGVVGGTEQGGEVGSDIVCRMQRYRGQRSERGNVMDKGGRGVYKMFNGSELENYIGFMLKVMSLSGWAVNRSNYTKIKVLSAYGQVQDQNCLICNWKGLHR